MQCLWPARFISQLRRCPASTENSDLRHRQQLVSHGGAAHPSINALEGDLKEGDFQKLLGRQPTPEVKAFSADVVANVLDKLELQGIRKANDEVISKAERNKA